MTRRGLTLVECLVGVTISGVLLGAMCAVLLAGQRAAIALAAALDARGNAEAAGSVLAGELRVLAPGELIALTESSVTIRALRGTGTACAVDAAGGTITLHEPTWSGLRAIDPARDSLRLLAERDPDRGDDDAWILAGIVSAGAGSCGTDAGVLVRLSGVTPGVLDSVGTGAPARLFEVAEYRRYSDGVGERWLGVRGPSPPGWSPSSPIAGPLNPSLGLSLSRDSSGLIEARVRVRGRLVRRPWGLAAARDSALVAMFTAGP